ncbi:MAG: rod shape-determining protein [Blastocatellia bacterium]|nr:MAG: rod shape-determining protein [Blastocatellia bacterium]
MLGTHTAVPCGRTVVIRRQLTKPSPSKKFQYLNQPVFKAYKLRTCEGSCRAKDHNLFREFQFTMRVQFTTKLLEKFFKHELAIDLGSVNTLIYDPSEGILLNEPSVVAIDKYDGEVIAVGHHALKLLGREPRGIEVHRPIHCGTIFNFEVTTKMLRTFLLKVMDGYRRGDFVVGIPGSATPVEQRSVRDAVRDAGGGRVDLIDEGLAAGLGAGLSFDDERAHLVVDIGGGTTNIAIVASGGIVSSISLPAAGNAMDEAIRDYIRSKYCVHIGECSAEQVKKQLGALHEENRFEGEASLEVVGKNLIDGSASAINVTSEEVREALEPILSEIVAGAQRMIEDAQPEAVADIYYAGIILTGGGSLLKGMKERLKEELELHVTVPENPMTTVVIGAGVLLGDHQQLYRCSVKQDLPVWEGSEELVVTW